MWKNVTKGFKLLKDFFIYFQKGWQAGLTFPYVRSFISSYLLHLNQFRRNLYSNGIELHTIRDEKIKKLQATSQGLYSLLPPDSRFTYSILMLVEHPHESYLKTSLEAAFSQSASSLEVLIACMTSPTKQLEQLFQEFKKQYPAAMHLFDFSKQKQKEDCLSHLAAEANGNFLLFMGEEDWIRPDLLYRYEQTLRMKKDPQNCVLYCDYNRLNAKGAFLPLSQQRQPSELCFPYIFKQFMAKGLLVPARLWKKVCNSPFCRGAADEDLLFRLDLEGAIFQHIPFCLYSVRERPKQQLVNTGCSFQKVLENYTMARGLAWKWSPGYLDTCARALPSLPKKREIQIIVPFKDQKKLTLQCIQSLLKQKEVSIKITAVDNRSSDPSIADAIRAMGGEVMFVDEPYNYSRLNNLAVKHTKTAGDCEAILFLNNDVELEADALQEMLRWVDQPGIGMVGCRLNFPDGRLQHGGVRLVPREHKGLEWEHREKFRSFSELQEAKVLGICEAVTAACAMMKRELFLAIEGFDEVWYPIGYSDTNLVVKLAARGLKCFYTPYAVGKHYESVSRKASIEDFESSWWLNGLWNNYHGNQSSSPK